MDYYINFFISYTAISPMKTKISRKVNFNANCIQHNAAVYSCV